MSSLGEVRVEVSAGLEKLTADFARGKQQAQQFDKDMSKVARSTDGAAHSTNRLESELRATTKAFGPLHLAAIRHETDMLRRKRLALQVAGGAGKMAGIVPPIPPIEKGAKAIGGLVPPINRVGVAASRTTMIMRGFIGAVGIGLAAQLAGTVTRAIEVTGKIDDLARSLGLTATQFQEWRGIGSMLGIEADTMAQGFEEFKQNVEQAAAGAARLRSSRL